MLILAVDPGLHGAFAMQDGRQLIVRDMPTYEAPAGKRGRDRLFLDQAAIVAHVTDFGVLDNCALVMEDVGGIPGQSAPAAFKFGEGVGLIIGAAMAVGMKIERVHPSTWKSALRVPADKRAARARASELLPAYSHLWPLQKHDGRAEAAMLALYGHQILGRLP